jgi:tetratricopeptide (TPR) repeat protein
MESRTQRLLRRIHEYEAGGNHDAARILLQALVCEAPGDVSAWLRLSQLEQRAGRYRESLSAAESAAVAERRSSGHEQLAYVTSRLLVFNELESAATLIEAADWNMPAVLRQSPALSQHLWLAGRYERALALIDAAQRRAAPSHLLAYSRAVALRYLGRMQEAGEMLEQCIRLAPAYAGAHWTLAYHAPPAPGASRIPRIRQALAVHDPASADAVDLLYALYREHEREADGEAAWAALMDGARRKRALVRGSPAAEVRVMLDLAQQPLPVPAVDESGEVDCVFVVGLPRTGTTLLERMLGNHSDVASAGELNDFHAALCWQTRRFLSHGDLPQLATSLAGSLPGAGARYLHTTRSRRGARRVLLDKNPANFIHAGSIAAALPRARILCLRRSPMDACFSNLKELFADDAYAYSYDLRELADHYAAFDSLRMHWEATMPGRFMTVDYDALVSEPERTVSEVLAFCGLPHQDGCARIERNLQPVPTASASQVREPVHRRFVGSWKRYAAQLEPLRRRLGELGIEVDG